MNTALAGASVTSARAPPTKVLAALKSEKASPKNNYITSTNNAAASFSEGRSADELKLQKQAAAYEEEQRNKAVVWFRSVGSNPTSGQECQRILDERQRMASAIDKKARDADRARIEVEVATADTNPKAIPIDVMNSVINGTFAHDDPAVIAATNPKLAAHLKAHGGPGEEKGTAISRSDLLLGNTGPLASVEALTRTVAQSARNAALTPAVSGAGGRGNTPTKRGATPPNNRSASKALDQAALLQSQPDDPATIASRKKIAADLETDKLLQLAMGGELFVGSDGSLASPNPSNNVVGQQQQQQQPRSPGVPPPGTLSSGASTGKRAGTADPANAAGGGITLDENGNLISPSQLAMAKEKALGSEVASKIHTAIGKLVADGKVTDTQAGAGLEARQALQEQIALMARIVLLRKRFDRRAAVAMRAMASANGLGIGNSSAAGTFSLQRNQNSKGVGFSSLLTLVEMPSLLAPTGDNPLTPAIPAQLANGGGGNDSAARGGLDSRQGGKGMAAADVSMTSTKGSPVGGAAGGAKANKAAAAAAAAAAAQQQAQLAAQHNLEKQQMLLKLAPATVVADSTNPNHLSLLGERIASATSMSVLAPKVMYIPFEFKLKGYTQFNFPASAGLNADPTEQVPTLPAGPDAVPEANAIIPALEHFSQPIPTLETFPLPRSTFALFGGISSAETLLSFDAALHSSTLGAQWSHVHDRSATTASISSALSLHTLAPMPFTAGTNGRPSSLGLGLESGVLAAVAAQQKQSAISVTSSDPSTSVFAPTTLIPSAGFLNTPLQSASPSTQRTAIRSPSHSQAATPRGALATTTMGDTAAKSTQQGKSKNRRKKNGASSFATPAARTNTQLLGASATALPKKEQLVNTISKQSPAALAKSQASPNAKGAAPNSSKSKSKTPTSLANGAPYRMRHADPMDNLSDEDSEDGERANGDSDEDNGGEEQQPNSPSVVKKKPLHFLTMPGHLMTPRGANTAQPQIASVAQGTTGGKRTASPGNTSTVTSPQQSQLNPTLTQGGVYNNAEATADAIYAEERERWIASEMRAALGDESEGAEDPRRWDPAHHHHRGPMLDQRLSFLMSNQLRANLPNDAYTSRTWIPLPAPTTRVNNNTSSAALTLQRLGATSVIPQSAKAFLP